ncbi:MAG: hypothetical protein ACI9UO_002609 [Nitrospinales bacterium]|jgi:hypothetical protein
MPPRITPLKKANAAAIEKETNILRKFEPLFCSDKHGPATFVYRDGKTVPSAKSLPAVRIRPVPPISSHSAQKLL